MKKIRALFCVLFLLLCAAPAALLAVCGPEAPGANETAAVPPSLTTRKGGVNWDYPSELASYVESGFPLRRACITANAALTAALLRESATDEVLLGKDGWLFYADTLDDYTGASAMTERELFRAARTLSLVQERCTSEGARFLFTVAPNKNTLYPEYMPEKYEKNTKESNWQRLMAALDAQSVAYCDLVPVLAAQPEPVYYRTDSHWTGYGSALACDALMSTFGGHSALAEEAFAPAPHLGDLYEMLLPAGTRQEEGLQLARTRTFSYEGAFRAADDQKIRTTGGGSGSLLMFRDSFGNLLHADLAEQFETATFLRANPIRLEDLGGADVVLFELVERNLPWLLTHAPVMPAPRRDLTLPEKTSGSAACTVSTTSPVEGCVRYTGTIDCPGMDTDSPIYVALDSAVYEATPSGDGAEAFTLYAPAAEKVSVLVRCGGEWVRCAS